MNHPKSDLLDNLSAEKLEKIVFIIDSISTAYAVAILAKNKAIHCIYECKEISWRKADFVKLYDFILSDVRFLSKEVIFVAHPFLKPAKTLFQRIMAQRNFVQEIRRQKKLATGYTYVASIISSILIANKNSVDSILIDEGIGSIIARNRLEMRGNKFSEKIKILAGELLLSFQFPNNTPQVTLTNDRHPSVIANLDYRDFSSTAFENALSILKDLMQQSTCNILVLLKGPSYGVKGHPNESDVLDQIYTDFNLQAIRAFLQSSGLNKHDSAVYLKSHPGLGTSTGKLDPLIEALARDGVRAYDALAHIDFHEASSLPAEGLLRYLNFSHVVAVDASSLLWNVAYLNAVECHIPLKAIIDFTEVERNLHRELYLQQYDINEMLGKPLRFYAVDGGNDGISADSKRMVEHAPQK
jgi:hypothetical protein